MATALHAAWTACAYFGAFWIVAGLVFGVAACALDGRGLK